jgi:Cof subfamily protein (haloacid dehalogenase superfamily)
MKNLYITDLDKTFLKSDLSLSKFTINTWNTLAKNGIHLTIATARSGTKSLELLDKLHLNHPLVVMDGAMIVNSSGEVLLINAIDKDRASHIIEISKEEGFEPLIVGLDENNQEKFIYSKNINNLQQELLQQYKDDKRLTFQEKLTPLKENVKIFYIGEYEPLLKLKNRFKDCFSNNIEFKLSKDPYIDGYFLTLLHPKGDKAHAIKELQNIDNLGSLKMTVFGDSHNDIGMFKIADTKIAINNAIEELKTIADEVLPHSNDEDGVARYLKKMYDFTKSKH